MLHIQDIFTWFRVRSGLRINFSKSEVLPLHHTCPPSWSTHSIFPIAKAHITYLGIKIGKSPSSLFHPLNYPPIVSKIIGELENWGSRNLPLIGELETSHSLFLVDANCLKWSVSSNSSTPSKLFHSYWIQGSPEDA